MHFKSSLGILLPRTGRSHGLAFHVKGGAGFQSRSVAEYFCAAVLLGVSPTRNAIPSTSLQQLWFFSLVLHSHEPIAPHTWRGGGHLKLRPGNLNSIPGFVHWSSQLSALQNHQITMCLCYVWHAGISLSALTPLENTVINLYRKRLLFQTLEPS